MFDIDKEIARHICLAQIASDAGKNIFRISIKGDEKAKLRGYNQKDVELLKAIRLIDSVPAEKTKFKYFVKQAKDQNGHTSRIVYFYYNDGIKQQVSFHCFNGKIKKLRNKGCVMSWDRGSSVFSVKILIKIFSL